MVEGAEQGRERARLEADRGFRDALQTRGVHPRRGTLLPADERVPCLGRNFASRSPASSGRTADKFELRSGREEGRRDGDAERGCGNTFSGTNRGTSSQRIERASGEF